MLKKEEIHAQELILSDFIYINLKNRQNSFMVIEDEIAVTFVREGEGVQKYTHVCQSLSCALKACALYCVHFAFKKKLKYPLHSWDSHSNQGRWILNKIGEHIICPCESSISDSTAPSDKR